MTLDRKIWYGVAAAVCAAALAGCGDGGPKTHPVAGRVVVPGGDASQLAGHHVELTRADDPTVRAAGVLDADGRFRLETLDRGAVKGGAREGSYQARLLLADEGDGRKPPTLPRKYLDFKTSGWTVQVPPPDDVTLTVSTK